MVILAKGVPTRKGSCHGNLGSQQVDLLVAALSLASKCVRAPCRLKADVRVIFGPLSVGAWCTPKNDQE